MDGWMGSGRQYNYSYEEALVTTFVAIQRTTS